MKKHLMVMLLAAAAQNINAQLVVDEDGKVGIGTESPQALLQIDKSTATDLGNVRGIKVYSRNSFGKNIGIESRAVSSSSFTCAVLGGVDSTFSAPAAGVMGYATWGRVRQSMVPPIPPLLPLATPACMPAISMGICVLPGQPIQMHI